MTASAHVAGETHDRRSIDLPAAQRTLATAILRMGKPVVIVLINGGSIALEPELAAPNVAIVEAFQPGGEGGHALARALFGDSNRWGKMPYAMLPAAWVEANPMHEHDIVASKRTYRYGATALVPFGHGLSYSSWALSLAGAVSWVPAGRPSPPYTLSTSGADGVNVSLTLTNRGPLAGDQVVQAYLVPLEISAPEVGARPVKSLFDFARARDVAAGGTATVAFRVDAESLKLVASNGDLVAGSGRYTLRFETGDPNVEVAEAEVRLVGATRVIERFPSIK